MKIKEILKDCTVDNINIALINCEADYTEMKIKIQNKKDFRDFINVYGNSLVFEWKISNGCGIPWMRFALKKLVKGVKSTITPTTKEELKEIIEETIEKQGLNCNLNFIDVSLIEDMNWLFAYSSFNGDISKWDTSNVKNMEGMFYHSKFNGDISNWDVSSVVNMSFMFSESIFNGDISKWDVSSVVNMRGMFYYSQINGIFQNGRFIKL